MRLMSGALLLFMLVVGPALAIEPQPLNGSFDHSTEGWTLSVDPSQAEMLWVGDDGDPLAGALELGVIEEPGFLLVEAWTDCFPLPPDPDLLAEARVKVLSRGSNEACYLQWALYSEPECGGSRLFLGNVQPNPIGIWERQVRPISVNPSRFPSARLSLSLLHLGPNPIARCRFDSVATNLPQPAVAVPTQSSIGLVLFALALVALGVGRILRGST